MACAIRIGYSALISRITAYLNPKLNLKKKTAMTNENLKTETANDAKPVLAEVATYLRGSSIETINRKTKRK